MKLRFYLDRFRRDQTGVATLELMVLLPILFTMFFASYSLFDLFFNYNRSIKATQTVSDIVSRQTVLDNEYLDRLHNVYRTISQTKPSETSWMRVTALVNEAPDTTTQNIVVAWSHVVGDLTDVYSTGDKSLEDFVPTLLPGQSVVVVETSRKAKPIFTWDPIVGREAREFPNSLTFPLRFSTNLANTDIPYVPPTSAVSGSDGAPGT